MSAGLLVALTAANLPAHDCGARCVERVLRSLGGTSIDLSLLIDELNGRTRDSLPSLSDLDACIESSGCTSELTPVEFVRFVPNTACCIAHVNSNHFVVIDEVAPDHVTAWWGPGENRRLSWQEFQSISSPVVLVATRTSKIQLQESMTSHVRRKRLEQTLIGAATAIAATALVGLLGWRVHRFTFRMPASRYFFRSSVNAVRRGISSVSVP
jgi:ABC-type bacteriocin/lantibiotic exporter with double-glycine peptidase domain